MSQNQNPEIRTFEFNDESIRLDKYLVLACPDITRSQIQKLIQSGNTTVNGLSMRPAYKLVKGNQVQIVIPPPELTIIEPEDIALDVLYSDPDLAVINKPANMTVYPAPGHPGHTLVNALLQRFPDLACFGSSMRPGIVHRLDKDTSGLMVIARHEKARLYLVEEFKQRTVKKGYIALVQGKLKPEQGAIDAPIGRDPTNRKRMAIVSKGREARTDYKVIGYHVGYTVVQAYIRSGRTHQIRVHFSSIGHPIFADSTYGNKSKLLNRQFLHAYFLEFRLPSTGELRSFITELPPDLKKVLADLR